MLKVVDIVYHCHDEYTDPKQVLDKHQPTLGFIDFIKERVDYTVIRHMNYEGQQTSNGIHYAFFRRRNAPWQIPLKTHRYIKSLQPDIVLVHGFIFPLQVTALKILLGKKTAIVLQHHADYPVNSVRKIFQIIANRHVHAYMFTAAAIAEPWIKHHVITDRIKIKELPGASVPVEKRDRLVSKQKLNFSGNNNFLWIGRLNDNKDPITVLKAFSKYVLISKNAKLFMIYQTDELLQQVKKIITENVSLQNHVRLIGKLSPNETIDWYNAADFFITGSHAEAAGYALLQALSVGCIPIVTNIPAFKKILNQGEIGYLFTPGDEWGLLKILTSLAATNVDEQSLQAENYFHKNLSNKNIADGIYDLCVGLHAVQL